METDPFDLSQINDCINRVKKEQASISSFKRHTEPLSNFFSLSYKSILKTDNNFSDQKGLDGGLEILDFISAERPISILRHKNSKTVEKSKFAMRRFIDHKSIDSKSSSQSLDSKDHCIFKTE